MKVCNMAEEQAHLQSSHTSLVNNLSRLSNVLKSINSIVIILALASALQPSQSPWAQANVEGAAWTYYTVR